MKIELRPLAELKPYEKNPRINDDAVAAVAKSIQEFGFRQPIVVDPAGVIVIGHTRWKAAKELGLDRVPVHVAVDLSPAQLRAYRIADNQTSTISTWDFGLLSIELGALEVDSFDLSTLGFGEQELAKLISPGDIAPDRPTAAATSDAEAAPEAYEEPQAGDVWLLGNHRLTCGVPAAPGDLRAAIDGWQTFTGQKAVRETPDKDQHKPAAAKKKAAKKSAKRTSTGKAAKR